MQLTPKQLEATDAIMEFFLNDEPYMVLSGYAGVVKSTVINHVTTEDSFSYLNKIYLSEVISKEFFSEEVIINSWLGTQL